MDVRAGAATSVISAVILAALLAGGGRFAATLPSLLAFSAALIAAGVGYDLLLATGRLSPGYAPGILFWCAAFPVVRVVQEMASGTGAAVDLAFLIWQVLVGGAFGLGFTMLHRNIGRWIGGERQ